MAIYLYSLKWRIHKWWSQHHSIAKHYCTFSCTFSKLHNLYDPLISQQNKTPHEKLRGKEGGGIEIRKTFVVLQLSLRNNCGGEKIINQVEPSQFGKMVSMVIS